MDVSDAPRNSAIGGTNEAVAGAVANRGEQRAVVAPTPVRRPLSVKITNREQIERLTPAQKQKLMRMVIAKRQLAGQLEERDRRGEHAANAANTTNAANPVNAVNAVNAANADKENVRDDGAVSALRHIGGMLEKRGSNRFPAPAESSPGAKRQKTRIAVADALQEHVSKVENPTLRYTPQGCNQPSISELAKMESTVGYLIRGAREALFRSLCPSKRGPKTLGRHKVHVRLVFRDGAWLARSLSLTQFFSEVPRIIAERESSVLQARSERHSSPGGLGDTSRVSAQADVMRQDLSELYLTHSRKLLDDFKAAHNICVLEINGIDPTTLPLGLDLNWCTGKLRTNRIGIVDLRAFRTGKSLEACLYYATSYGQAWDVMHELRPIETVHLNWRLWGRNTTHSHHTHSHHNECKYSELVRINELFYAPLDTEAKNISGFDAGAMRSLWSSTVSDDEKRGILRCLKFHLVPGP